MLKAHLQGRPVLQQEYSIASQRRRCACGSACADQQPHTVLASMAIAP